MTKPAPQRPDMRKLALPTKKGGAEAESAYADWHKQHGQPLRKKYRKP